MRAISFDEFSESAIYCSAKAEKVTPRRKEETMHISDILKY